MPSRFDAIGALAHLIGFVCQNERFTNRLDGQEIDPR